jgi:predicted O-methyltransferase YrrM
MDGKEELMITDDSIIITHNNKRHQVMHRCETSIMEKQAEITTQNGGDILEIGFGMHISADFITSNPNVTSYTLIEIHPQQYERALEWAKTKTIPVNVILGDWYDVLPLSDTKFDGVFFDSDTDKNGIVYFLDKVKDNCKNGTVVTFYAYYEYDKRLTPVVIPYTKEEFEKLPDAWKKVKFFSGGSYNIHYTKYDGNEFYGDGRNLI